jgi:hypothetical protein
MALSELTSNLSWYGTNAGFRAQTNVEQTRFNYDPGDLTVAIAPRGFDQVGNQSNAFIPRVSGNTFNINGQGTATRLSQQGTGTKFPIGPEGQVHEFDIKRTGFSILSRYGDTFDSKTLKGLAATYTANSPIDDMYNKFKVREEVHDPFGYAKPPFILRGIQRDDSSKPQRWGIGDTTAGTISSLLDIPRGGPLVMGDRILNDAVRLGKMMIRPQGLAFIAKQQLLHMMQPNTEGVMGYPNLNFVTNQKLSSPANTLASALGSPLGLRYKKYGLLPTDDGISKYEDIHKNRYYQSFAIPDLDIKQNRLVLLLDERKTPSQQINPTWITLDSVAGPNSIGGIGDTIFHRWKNSDTTAKYELNLQYKLPVQYTIDDTYASTFSLRTYPIEERSNTSRNITIYRKDSLRERVNKNDFTAIPQREVQQAASNTSEVATGISSYRTLAYANIPKERKPGQISILEPNRSYGTNDAIANWSAENTPIAAKLADAQKDKQLTDDTSLIKFTIAGISFLAYLTNLSFDDQLGVEEKKELMAPFGQYVFSSLDRGVSVSFILAASNQSELTSNWNKVKQLQNALAPDLGNGTRGVLRPKSANITIGDIYDNARVIIESVSYAVDNESPWDITGGKQYAYYITVDVQCKVLPSSKTSLPTINV